MHIERDIKHKSDVSRSRDVPAAAEERAEHPRWPAAVLVMGLLASLVWTAALVWLAARLIF